MTPAHYLAILRRRWSVVLWVALLCTGAAVAVTVYSTPQFRASSTVFFSVSRGETVGELVQGSTYTQSLVQSYARMATMPVVLDPVIDDLRLPATSRQLARAVTAEAPLNTVLVEITATDPSPERAARIADAVAFQLSQAADDLSPTGPDGDSAISVTTVAGAEPPLEPSSPQPVLNVGLGATLGLLVGLGLAALIDALDTKVRTEDDVRQVTDAPIVGRISFDAAQRAGAVLRPAGQSARGEAYRRLRTNLQFLETASRLRSVVVTSCVPGEGKTTTAINLAVAMAEAQVRVLLVDADLRRPQVAAYTALEGAAGLTTVLLGRASAADVVQPWGNSGELDVLCSGVVPPNPSELLGSEAMARLLASLQDAYDLVILDAPPLLPVADPTVLAKQADGVLLVANVRVINRQQLSRGTAGLQIAGARLLGVVLNGVAQTKDDAYYGSTAAVHSLR